MDAVLAEDYSLWHLPALAFFRHSTPILYTGDINNEEEVFEFLFQNKYTADEDIDLEEVDEEKLEILINHIDFVVVLFYKEHDAASKQAQQDVDSIDDNLKERSISVVKTRNQDQIDMYEIDILPKLVYFEAEIPTFWPDELSLTGNETILKWIEKCQDSDVIEDITEEMLEKLIANTDHIAVFFYDKKDKEQYEEKLDGLENIDDELDSFELPFVKINSRTIALDFGFEEVPALAFFQKGIPTRCDVDLIDEGQVLKWILIEARAANKPKAEFSQSLRRHLLGPIICLLCDGENLAYSLFAALIEADLWVEPPVVEQLFLIESTRAELEWPVEAAPSLVIFESDEPQFYAGDLGDTEAVLAWLRLVLCSAPSVP